MPNMPEENGDITVTIPKGILDELRASSMPPPPLLQYGGAEAVALTHGGNSVGEDLDGNIGQQASTDANLSVNVESSSTD